jgi:oligopeptide transport system substrate-binding protein
VAQRERLREEWNRPVLWPLAAATVVLGAVLLPAAIAYRRRERSTAR